MKGERGQLWNRGSAPVHPNHKYGTFQFLIVATNINAPEKSKIRGDIAVDDLSFSLDCQADTSTLPSTHSPTTLPEECLEDETSCNDSAHTCVKNSKVCDFVNDCPNNYDEVNPFFRKKIFN